MIAVVIPYFQREPGILRRALASVAAQQDVPGPVTVLVVDDASPVPARSEVEGIAFPDGMQLRVIEQVNGGPGAARNTGLDAVPSGTTFVAFLDSDDEWSTDHLTRAISALDAAFDVYFADHLQLGQSVGAFERAGRLNPGEHPLLPGRHAGQHQYSGDMFDQVLRGNVIGTPTVAYRIDRFPAQRFLVEFTTAGEDYLFWMTLAQAGARFAFSSTVEAVCGKGVNVYSGSGWGTPAFFLRVHQEICFRLAVRRLFPLNAQQKQHLAQDLARLREVILRDLLRRLRSREPLRRGLLTQHLRRDAATVLAAPRALIRALRRA